MNRAIKVKVSPGKNRETKAVKGTTKEMLDDDKCIEDAKRLRDGVFVNVCSRRI